jgi:hypothetical protein
MREAIAIFEGADPTALRLSALAMGGCVLLFLVGLVFGLVVRGAGRHRRRAAELRRQAEELQRLLEWRQAQLEWLIARLRALEQQVQAMLASQARPPGRLRLDERGNLLEEN